MCRAGRGLAHPEDFFAGQQILVDRLGEECVAERVVLAVGRHENVGFDCRAHRGVESAVGEIGAGCQQLVRHLASGNARRPHHEPRVAPTVAP